MENKKVSHRLGLYDLIWLSTRVFLSKKSRTILTILGTSIGIGAVVFLVSLGYGLQYIILGRLVSGEASLRTIQVSRVTDGFVGFTEEETKQIGAMSNVKTIARVAELSGEAKVEGISGLLVVRLVDDEYPRLAGMPFAGSFQGAFASPDGARLLNISTSTINQGKEIAVDAFFPTGNEGEFVQRSVTLSLRGVSGVAGELPSVTIPIGSFGVAPTVFKEVFVEVGTIEEVRPLAAKLTEAGYTVSARLDLIDQARKIMTAITYILSIFGIVALMVSAIGMFNTMLVGFLERTEEIGIMKAIGGADADIRNVFLLESALMGFSGGAVGLLLGVAGGWLVEQVINSMAIRAGALPLHLFSLPQWFIVVVLVSSFFIGIAAGVWPASRAMRLSPKEAFLRK